MDHGQMLLEDAVTCQNAPHSGNRDPNGEGAYLQDSSLRSRHRMDLDDLRGMVANHNDENDWKEVGQRVPSDVVVLAEDH